MPDPLPTPIEAYWIRNSKGSIDYRGYLGDEIKFADSIYIEGTNIFQSIHKLMEIRR